MRRCQRSGWMRAVPTAARSVAGRGRRHHWTGIFRRGTDVKHGNKTQCPCCGAAAHTVKTDQVTPTVRKVVYKCGAETCQMIWEAEIVAVRVLHPSRLPDFAQLTDLRSVLLRSADQAAD